MSKDVRLLLLALGLPAAAAMLVFSLAFAWRSISPVPAHAQGAGVNSERGYALTTLDVGGGTQYVVVSSHTQHGADPTPRQFLTFYEIRRTGTGTAELHLVGSRCVEFDRGFAELNFKSPRGYVPTELEEKLERYRQPPKQRRPKANEPAPPAEEPPMPANG